MSCGNPHEVDCAEVLARASRFLEHSLAEGGSVGYESFEQHLRECPPCVDQVTGQVEQLQAVILSALDRCCHEHAPDDLRLRVVHSMRMWSATVRTEAGDGGTV
jgi:anti-sigma factor (TIGR02949 family)